MRKGRPKKVRYIQKMPQAAQFSPRGRPGRPDEIQLNVDHFEAIKLADYQGYDQSEGAQAMGISRPSFGRILREGRKIIADALANGKIIRIRIGDVQVGVHHRDLSHKDAITAANNVKSTHLKREETLRENILQYKNSSITRLPAARK